MLQQPALWSVMQMFDVEILFTGPVLLNTGPWFDSAGERQVSCKQFSASNGPPVQLQEVCDLMIAGCAVHSVSVHTGRHLSVSVTNNGGYINNCIAGHAGLYSGPWSKQARKRCSRNFFPPCTMVRGLYSGPCCSGSESVGLSLRSADTRIAFAVTGTPSNISAEHVPQCRT